MRILPRGPRGWIWVSVEENLFSFSLVLSIKMKTWIILFNFCEQFDKRIKIKGIKMNKRRVQKCSENQIECTKMISAK